MIKEGIKMPKTFLLRKCTECGSDYGPETYTKTKSIFYPDGYLPLCNECLREILEKDDFSWDVVDKICQYADIPFIPDKFEDLRAVHGNDVFPIYAEIFFSEEFEGIGWGNYFREFKRLKEEGAIEDELPGIREERLAGMRDKWGANYDLEALTYLENLYTGLLMTQNVNGALQGDQALKICKISYELDSRIREGTDFDKMLASYDKLVKTAEFTPKNVKNASDFDSTGELFRWLEKRGWRNKFFDDVSRDIVDETIMNIQNYNQRLYTNESGIGDEITRRIESLKVAKELETNYYGTDEDDYDLDNYDNEGYEKLFKEDDEFSVEAGIEED